METFHRRTVLSSEPEARISLDDDHAMSLIPFVWPWKLWMNSPVREFHSFISLSAASRQLIHGGRYAPAVARYLPSGLNLTDDMAFLCPERM